MCSFLIIPFVLVKERSFLRNDAQPYATDLIDLGYPVLTQKKKGRKLTSKFLQWIHSRLTTN